VASKVLARSFAAGEISPELYARVDLAKHQTGVAEALNFWTLPHGPAQNRPGFEYVLEVKDSTKAVYLIEFEFSTEQTFMLEFGDQYVRFHTNGGTLLETGLNITGISQPAGLITSNAHGLSNGDWVFLSGIVGMTELNGRYVVVSDSAANTFRMKDFAGAYITTGDFTAYTSGGTAARVYTVATPYLEADLFRLHYTQSADVLTIVHPTYAPRELRRLGATNWQLSTITFAPTIATPGAPTTTPGGPGGGTPVDNTYVCTAIASDTLEESLASASDTESYDLTVATNFIDVDPPTVSGAVRYNIYKLKNGLYGFIGQTDGSALRDNNITPDVGRTPAIASTPFNATDDFPGAVGYAEGRRAFGGTNNKPQNFWLTRSGTESNLSYSIPTRDDDTIAGRILARQANRIRHILPMADLVLLTSGGEWRISPQNSDILTPDSAAPKVVSNEGASDVTPAITGTAVLYVEALGSHIRELDYKKDRNGQVTLEPRDVAVLAPHLFDGYAIVDMAYTKRPYKMVWAARSDGVLLGLTYLPEHDVTAWHQHSTEGLFESVAAVAEGSSTALYAVVARTVNGRAVRYIERMRSRAFATLADAFLVDAGSTYDGAATTSIAGLHHLEGETVSVLADGSVHPQLVVVDGAITLENAASKVHVGLPITADLQTLSPAIEEAQAFGSGLLKNATRIHLRVNASAGIKVGPTFAMLREYTPRTSEPYGSPPSLKTGTISLSLDNKWSLEAQVCIRQSDPLPLTILSQATEYAIGG
jgi:hypothetical protein